MIFLVWELLVFTCTRSPVYLKALNELRETPEIEFNPRHNLDKNRFYRPFLNVESKGQNHVFVDLGARNLYGADSALIYFEKQHDKFKRYNFTIHAWEMDSRFHSGIASAKFPPHQINLISAAAWTEDGELDFSGKMGQLTINNRMRLDSNNDEKSQSQKVKTKNFSNWLQQHVKQEDYVLVKMDIEGAEYDVLQLLIATNTICLIDELFVEIHFNRFQRTRKGRQNRPQTWKDVVNLSKNLHSSKTYHHLWF